MSITNSSTQMKQLILGNTLLLICSTFYLAWWVVAFRPNGGHTAVSTGLLIFAFGTGIIGLYNMIAGMSRMPYETTLFPQRTLLWSGVIVYLVALAITYYAFKRQITSELLLIIGWGVLELSVINIVYGTGAFSAKTAVVLCSVIVIAIILSLVCYVAYYRLSGTASYVDGMLPLIMEALVMIVLIIRILYTR
ncbi:MAG: hypothetical protein Q4G58_09100 [bacterium]|nr:hypothetical protein [bacterium]